MNSGVTLALSNTSAGINPNIHCSDFHPDLDLPDSTKSTTNGGVHTNTDNRSLKEKKSLIFGKHINKYILKDTFLLETETIKEWWIGHVLEVFPEQRYFTAHIRDLKFVESVAEFDFDSVFPQNEPDLYKYLFNGAEFAFFVLIRHGVGSPETISRVEFSSPYIWKEGDDKKAEALYLSLFEKDDI